jgi:type IV pilus assembly protein PilX
MTKKIGMAHTFGVARQQRGAVLAISLIVLLVLITLSVSTARSTLMQEKMTAAVTDTHIALENSEFAIRSAETTIEALTSLSGFADDGKSGLYTKNNGPSDVFAATTWDTEKTKLGAKTPVTGINKAAYFIENIGVIDDEDGAGDINVVGYGQTTGGGTVNAFRIVARGEGRSTDSVRYITSLYGKRL